MSDEEAGLTCECMACRSGQPEACLAHERDALRDAVTKALQRLADDWTRENMPPGTESPKAEIRGRDS